MLGRYSIRGAALLALTLSALCFVIGADNILRPPELDVNLLEKLKAEIKHRNVVNLPFYDVYPPLGHSGIIPTLTVTFEDPKVLASTAEFEIYGVESFNDWKTSRDDESVDYVFNYTDFGLNREEFTSTSPGLGVYLRPRVVPNNEFGGVEPKGEGNYVKIPPEHYTSLLLTSDYQFNYFGLHIGALDDANEIYIETTDRTIFFFSARHVLNALEGREDADQFKGNPVPGDFFGTNYYEMYVFVNFFINNSSVHSVILTETIHGAFESDHHTVGLYVKQSGNILDPSPVPTLSPSTESCYTELCSSTFTETSPNELLPVETSPNELPPVETSPVEIPPVETSPVEIPPVVTSPVEIPPVETSPVEIPPVETLPQVETPKPEVPDVVTPPSGGLPTADYWSPEIDLPDSETEEGQIPEYQTSTAHPDGGYPDGTETGTTANPSAAPPVGVIAGAAAGGLAGLAALGYAGYSMLPGQSTPPLETPSPQSEMEVRETEREQAASSDGLWA